MLPSPSPLESAGPRSKTDRKRKTKSSRRAVRTGRAVRRCAGGDRERVWWRRCRGRASGRGGGSRRIGAVLTKPPLSGLAPSRAAARLPGLGDLWRCGPPRPAGPPSLFSRPPSICISCLTAAAPDPIYLAPPPPQGVAVDVCQFVHSRLLGHTVAEMVPPPPPPLRQPPPPPPPQRPILGISPAAGRGRAGPSPAEISAPRV